MYTIALLAQKGGTGKTTLAVHVAADFEGARGSAALVDLDPQASAARRSSGGLGIGARAPWRRGLSVAGILVSTAVAQPLLQRLDLVGGYAPGGCLDRGQPPEGRLRAKAARAPLSR